MRALLAAISASGLLVTAVLGGANQDVALTLSIALQQNEVFYHHHHDQV